MVESYCPIAVIFRPLRSEHSSVLSVGIPTVLDLVRTVGSYRNLPNDSLHSVVGISRLFGSVFHPKDSLYFFDSTVNDECGVFIRIYSALPITLAR